MEDSFKETYKSAVSQVKPAQISRERILNHYRHKKYRNKIRAMKLLSALLIIGALSVIVTGTVYAYQRIQRAIRVEDRGVVIDSDSDIGNFEGSDASVVIGMGVKPEDAVDLEAGLVVKGESEHYDAETVRCNTLEEARQFCDFPISVPEIDAEYIKKTEFCIQNGTAQSEDRQVIVQYELENDARFAMTINCHRNENGWTSAYEFLKDISARSYVSSQGYEYVIVENMGQENAASVYAFFASDDYEVMFRFQNLGDNGINVVLDAADLSVYVN